MNRRPEQYPAGSNVGWDDIVAAFQGPFIARLKQEVDKQVRSRERGGRAGAAA